MELAIDRRLKNSDAPMDPMETPSSTTYDEDGHALVEKPLFALLLLRTL